MIKNLATRQNQDAWNVYQETVSLIQNHARTFLYIGKNLKRIRDDRLYRYLGDGGYDSFEQFIQNAEIGLSYSTARLYIHVYEVYVERLKFSIEEILSVPLYRLQKLKSYIQKKTRKEAEEVIENAKVLTGRDFREYLYEQKIEEKPLYIIARCKRCGKIKIVLQEEHRCSC